MAKQIVEDAVRVNVEFGGETNGATGGYDDEEDAFTFYDGINEWEDSLPLDGHRGGR